jgi:hypothetical protein
MGRRNLKKVVMGAAVDQTRRISTTVRLAAPRLRPRMNAMIKMRINATIPIFRVMSLAELAALSRLVCSSTNLFSRSSGEMLGDSIVVIVDSPAGWSVI